MKKCIIAIFSALLFCITANASSIDLSSYNNKEVSFTVLPYPSGESDGNFDVGITEGFLNGDPSETIDIFCVDFFDQITVPTTYQVIVRSLQPAVFTADNMGLTLSQLQQQATLGTYFSGNTAQDIGIQHDIWDYTGGGFPIDSNYAAALAAYSTRDYSSSYLFDITSEPGQQSFMTVDASPTGAPEPSTWALGALGVVSVFFFVGVGARRHPYSFTGSPLTA